MTSRFKTSFMPSSIEHEFITLINVKMPRVADIFKTFNSMINATPGRLKAKEVLIFLHFSFYEQLKCHAQC